MLRLLDKSMRRGRMRGLVYALLFAFAVIGLLPANSEAAVIPADQADRAAVRADNLASVQAALERQEVASRLADYGLTPQEVNSRLDQLTDQQVAELAAQADKINAGGDTLGMLISVALLVLLVLLILHLLGYIDLKLPRPSKPAAKPST